MVLSIGGQQVKVTQRALFSSNPLIGETFSFEIHENMIRVDHDVDIDEEEDNGASNEMSKCNDAAPPNQSCLKVTVLDRYLSGKNKVLGRGKLSLRLLANRERPRETVLMPINNHGAVVHLQTVFVADDKTTDAKQYRKHYSGTTSTTSSAASSTQRLGIEVISATSLCGDDALDLHHFVKKSSSASSCGDNGDKPHHHAVNAFVALGVRGAAASCVQRTRILSNNNSPMWHERFFVEVPKPNSRRKNAEILLRVFDEHSRGVRCIGECHICIDKEFEKELRCSTSSNPLRIHRTLSNTPHGALFLSVYDASQ